MSKPQGFTTLFPYFFMEGAERFCSFLVEGLGGEETGRSLRDDGLIANAQIQIGDTMVMVSEAGRGFAAMPASYYLYVDDANASMLRAIAAGGEEIMAVQNMDYGDRQGGIRDGHGNIWWISQHLRAGYD